MIGAFEEPIVAGALPTWIKREEPRPINQDAGGMHVTDSIGGVPGAGDTPKPAIVFAGSVEPYDRCSKHLAFI